MTVQERIRLEDEIEKELDFYEGKL